ncbi:MAG: 2-oxoacid:acceptor oxidoreductase family protein [Elusimicrobiota bacterium]
MQRCEIRIAGFGGQGVILAGIILGKAASLFDRKHAVMGQSFGPEARGSTCSSQVILSDEPIRYPYVRVPNVLMALSQESYNKYGPQTTDDAVVIVEEELVKPGTLSGKRKSFSIPATRMAEELGKKLVVNIVMVGFFTAVTRLLNKEAVRKAVEDSVPKGTEQLNLKAFEKGYEFGMRAAPQEAQA